MEGPTDPSIAMIVIIGLVVLVTAVTLGVTGIFANGGSTRRNPVRAGQGRKGYPGGQQPFGNPQQQQPNGGQQQQPYGNYSITPPAVPSKQPADSASPTNTDPRPAWSRTPRQMTVRDGAVAASPPGWDEE
jgi:hypothetical protein